MEEDKTIKRKKIIKNISRILSYTFIVILMFIASFFILYVACGKIAEKRGENPPFGLYTIISPSMMPNIKVYDVVFVKKTDTKNLKVNDVITFYSTNKYFGNTPITHRIVDIIDVPDRGIVYQVKGDANQKADAERVSPNNVLGKVVFKIPQLGKIQFYLASKSGWFIALLIPTIFILVYDVYKIVSLIKIKNTMNKYNPNI